MRPVKFDEKAQAYRERVAELAKQRRLVRKPSRRRVADFVMVGGGIVANLFVWGLWVWTIAQANGG